MWSIHTLLRGFMMFTLKSAFCVALLALCLPAYAASCSFDAYIEDDDLYSSKGVKLSTVGQIIRQDRANFYTAAAGTGDSPDYCGFDKAHNREALQKIIDKSKINKATQNRIKRGNVNVTVNIINGRTAQVSTYD